MHRITKVTIENYRSFFGEPGSLSLPNGENLLLYGENGSGKSSLFLALQEWMLSSHPNWDTASFTRQSNIFSIPNRDPIIEVTVGDFQRAVGSGSTSLVSETTKSCKVAGRDTLRDPIVVRARRSLGFLTYRQLLKTYFLNNGNLFDLLVTEVMSDFVPSGSLESIGKLWGKIASLQTMHAGRDEFTQIETVDIPAFNALVMNLLTNELQPLVNRILDQYFEHGVQVVFSVPNVKVRRSRGRIVTVQLSSPHRSVKQLSGNIIQVSVTFFGQLLSDHSKILNEARLNALAISMFLAGRILQPTHTRSTIRTLLLDDIFIGLDTSNRIPLLRLLTDTNISYIDSTGNNVTKSLFAEYQIFLSTYDRYWFNVSREWFDRNSKGKWKSYEMYVYSHGTNNLGLKFDQALLKQYGENIGTATRYLQHPTHPDYVASATFFRKAAEELLMKFLPDRIIEKAKKAKREKRPDDQSPELEPIMLKDLCGITESLLTQMQQPTAEIGELKYHLRTLLNPMSHYEREQSPLFREELIRILKLLRDDLPPLLFDLKSRMALAVPIGNKIRIRFYFGPKHIGWYDLILGSDLFAIKDPTTGIMRFSDCIFTYSSAFDFDGTKEVQSWGNTPRKKELSKVQNIAQAYDLIYDHLLTKNPSLHKFSNCIDACKYLINNRRPKSLERCLDHL